MWGLALFSFLLAASTGAYFRFTLVAPLPGIHEYIRHAHSHLMFFSWVTPALILLIGWDLRRRGREGRGFPLLAIGAAVGGLLTYYPFLKSGYHLTPFMGKLLPISMLTSGLNGFVWYAFAITYFFSARGLKRDVRLRLYDVAVIMMLVSTVAIAVLAYLGVSGQVQRPVMLALVDWFLTLFADGWFGLAILALAALTADRARLASWPMSTFAWLLGAGMVVRSVGRFAADATSLSWGTTVESLGGALAAAMWLLLIYPLLRVGNDVLRGSDEPAPPTGITLLLRQLVLLLLFVKGAVELLGATPLLREWIAQPSLHIFFLHAFLLGAVSFSLIGSMRLELGEAGFRGAAFFIGAVGLMVSALLPLTPVWPRALAGVWVLRAAAYTSLLPVLVALYALVVFIITSAKQGTRSTTAAGAPEARAR